MPTEAAKGVAPFFSSKGLQHKFRLDFLRFMGMRLARFVLAPAHGGILIVLHLARLLERKSCASSSSSSKDYIYFAGRRFNQRSDMEKYKEGRKMFFESGLFGRARGFIKDEDPLKEMLKIPLWGHYVEIYGSTRGSNEDRRKKSEGESLQKKIRRSKMMILNKRREEIKLVLLSFRSQMRTNEGVVNNSDEIPSYSNHDNEGRLDCGSSFPKRKFIMDEDPVKEMFHGGIM